ncbi:MAG: diaminopimelate epimerase, partial [Burkholderiaceae bacterium]|nr:diaminopimelate epimerase [Burkholderiaceae bacterium]
MHIPFTKMQGAGNDFVVLDETRGLLGLTAGQYRWLA